MNEKLNAFIEQEEFKEDEGFRVTDDGKADWAVREIANNKRIIDKNKRFAEERKHQIDRWLKSENETLENNINFLEGLLNEYLMETKQTSVKLPSGNVNLRKQQPSWTYDDETIIKSLEASQMDEFVRIKKEVNKAELKKSVEVVDGKAVNVETGEVIEGITVRERGRKLNVRVFD